MDYNIPMNNEIAESPSKIDDFDNPIEYIASKIVRPDLESRYTIKHGKHGEFILQSPTWEFTWVVSSLEQATEIAIESEAINFPTTLKHLKLCCEGIDVSQVDLAYGTKVIRIWEIAKEMVIQDVRVAWYSAQSR